MNRSATWVYDISEATHRLRQGKDGEVLGAIIVVRDAVARKDSPSSGNGLYLPLTLSGGVTRLPDTALLGHAKSAVEYAVSH